MSENEKMVGRSFQINVQLYLEIPKGRWLLVQLTMTVGKGEPICCSNFERGTEAEESLLRPCYQVVCKPGPWMPWWRAWLYWRSGRWELDHSVARWWGWVVACFFKTYEDGRKQWGWKKEAQGAEEIYEEKEDWGVSYCDFYWLPSETCNTK